MIAWFAKKKDVAKERISVPDTLGDISVSHKQLDVIAGAIKDVQARFNEAARVEPCEKYDVTINQICGLLSGIVHELRRHNLNKEQRHD